MFSGEGELATFLNCIFVGKCNTSNDVNNPENTVQQLANVDSQSPGKDENGKDIPAKALDGDNQVKIIEEAVDKEVNQQLDEAVPAKTEAGTITSRVVKRIVASYIGEEASNAVPDNPNAYWQLLQKIAKFHNMVKNHTISKMVKKARLAQVVAIYTMYAVARDQAKSGQLTAEEYKNMVKTTDSFDLSEAWQQHIASQQSASAATVLAAASSPTAPNPNIAKEDYCSGRHLKQKGDFAWFCDDQKPNSGGNASSFEDAYNSSVGYLISPIAAAVNAVNKTPFGTFINWVSNFVGNVLGKITSFALDPILNALGIQDKIGGLVTWAMQRFMQFAGVMPMFSGDEPGVANFITAGSAGSAESTTRQAGGVASTTQTLNYSNRLASNYQKDQRAEQSTFEKFASLENPDSVSSKALFSFASTDTASKFQSLTTSVFNLSSAFGKLFTMPTFAASDNPASATAQWAGVDTYDIPQQCELLDPLNDNYLELATNAAQVSGSASLSGNNLGWTTMRDSGAFWKAVYGKLQGDTDAKELAAGKIYNCALLDKQVMGSLGSVYGYTDDGGLSSVGNN